MDPNVAYELHAYLSFLFSLSQFKSHTCYLQKYNEYFENMAEEAPIRVFNSLWTKIEDLLCSNSKFYQIDK